MAEKVVLINIHGMGKEEEPDFDRELREDLAKRLGSSDWGRVHVDSVYYQGILQPNQKAVMDAMGERKLDWKLLRKFMLFSFSDAAAVERNADEIGSPYHQVQKLIRQALSEAYDELERDDDGDPAPVVVMAKSLGGHLISNYTWDAQQDAPSRGTWKHEGPDPDTAKDDFLRLKTLKYFYTTGCNIPIFTAAFPRHEIKPIATDSEGYSILWKNFYDPDDPLGWPLKPLSKDYAKAVHEEHAINASGSLLGWIFQSWNPFSHTRYWKDRKVLDSLTADIHRLLL